MHEDAPRPAVTSGVWLGLDVGTRDLGVAVGNELTGRARPLKTLAMQPEALMWTTLDAMVSEWAPGGIVVGLPLTREGGEQPMSKRARRFAAAVEQRYQRPVVQHDERGSTQVAKRRFAGERAAGNARRKHAVDIDAHAAAVILEDYLALAGH
ncbi:MAG: Holliday junction resolvase RuvX [Lysobacterales bacterium]|nr:Holliday junction resolvase RuvX [Xanthomonadales bacterium]MCB1612305.1 Holliday junction resolvase RuvX [Xanthomonadales bacterium]